MQSCSLLHFKKNRNTKLRTRDNKEQNREKKKKQTIYSWILYLYAKKKIEMYLKFFLMMQGKNQNSTTYIKIFFHSITIFYKNLGQRYFQRVKKFKSLYLKFKDDKKIMFFSSISL